MSSTPSLSEPGNAGNLIDRLPFPWLARAIENEQRAHADKDGGDFQSHVTRPGPQPHNQIGTLREQWLLSRTPRKTPQQTEQAAHAELVALIEVAVRQIIAAELPAAIAYLLHRLGDNHAA